MRAYQLARELSEVSWADAEKLKKHRVTDRIAGQVYAAVGSIAANIAEGQGRNHTKEFGKA